MVKLTKTQLKKLISEQVEKSYSAFLVVDENGDAVGVFTDRARLREMTDENPEKSFAYFLFPWNHVDLDMPIMHVGRSGARSIRRRK